MRILSVLLALGALLLLPSAASAADGTGTMTVSPQAVSASSAANTLTFTYAADSAGLLAGEVDVTVPTGWTAPQTSNPTGPGYVSSNLGIAGISPTDPMTIQISGLTMTAPETFAITYANAAAPSTPGTDSFDTSEASTTPPAGTVTPIATSPSVQVVAPDGSGSMVVSPNAVSAGSTQSLTFTYTAGVGGMQSGEVDVTVPNGWTAPQTGTGGNVTSSVGSAGISGGDPRTIQVTGLTLGGGVSFTITYSAGTVPSSPGSDSFATSEASTPPPGGTVTPIGSSPSVQVFAPDGSGTMAVSPSNVSAGSTQSLTFTYKAATGGMQAGEVDVTVPSGWPAPQTGSGGNVTSTAGTAAISASNPQTIQVTGLTLPGGQSFTITYSGVTVPSSPGSSHTFSTSEASTAPPTGTVTPLTAPPVVGVVAPDGSGTMSVAPGAVSAGSTRSLTFTYTAASGGLQSGEVDLAVPSGWTAPQTGSGAGGVSSSAGSVAISTSDPSNAGVIEVSGLTLSAGQSFQITYGGAAVQSTSGSPTFTTKEASVAGDASTAIPSSPTVQVVGADGSGSTAVSPGNVSAGSTRSLTFTYTAGAGGTQSGEVDLTVPSGWTAPQTASGAGSVTSTAGTVGISSSDSRTVQVTGLNLSAGQSFQITYGGASVQPGFGAATFPTKEASVAGDAPTAIGTSPSVQVVAADGSGTMSVSPSTVSAGSTQSLTFTYTAGAGGTQSGEVDVKVPSGWTAPQTGSGAGSVTSTAGTVRISSSDSRTIQVTGVTLSAGQSFQITYGGATAQSSSGSPTLNTKEASVAGDAPTPIGSSPTVEVAGADGSGAMSVSPSTVSAGSAQSLTFTYTAGMGGMQSGEVDLTVPSGWTAPQTGSGGNVTATAGSAGISASDLQTIQVTGLNLSSGQSFQVTYGTVTVPASSGSATFLTKEASVAGDAPVAIGASPSVHVVAADGSGSMSVTPSSVSAGSTRSLTFKYTAGPGGMQSGEVDVKVPSGWPAPQTGSSVSSSAGTVGVSSTDPMTIQVKGVTLSAGQSFQLVYGGASVPSTPGSSSTFATSEASTATPTGTLTPIAPSPSVDVVSPDGSGAMAVSSSSTTVSYGSTQTLTFTYTAGPGGMASGEVDVVVPSGWTAPQTSSGAGSVSSTSGSVAISSASPRTIQVTGITLPAGSSNSVQITYAGATAESPAGPATFTTSEASVAGEAPAAIGAPQPTVAVTPTAPGPPTQSAPSPGNGEVTLHWTAPADNGGQDITGYTIDGSSSAGSIQRTAAPDATSLVVDGLTNGTAYTFTMVAQNPTGSSGHSNPETATPATVPAAPTLVGSSAGAGVVEIMWTPTPAADDGGAPITGYEVFRSTTAGQRGGQVATVYSGSSYIDQGVTDNTTYYYEVAAVNQAGPSAASNQLSVTPKAFVPPPTLATTKTIEGHRVTFSAPNQCISAGKVRGKLAISSHISHAKKLLFGRSVFRVGTLAKKTVPRSRPSSLPVRITMYVKHMAPGGSYPFSVASSIRVGSGSSRTYRFRLRITAC